MTVKDGTFHCDFAGSSPQVRGPFNCVPSGSLAAACYAVRAVTDPAIPTNAGCFRPITLALPKGSVVNPLEPAPVNSRTATIKRITGCILGALKDVLPERVPADSSGELVALMFGGRHGNGQPFVTGELIAGGSGAGPHSDGVDVIETDVTNCMNLPVEAMEMDAPIRVHRLALRQDSGGAGRHRGGLGVVKEYEILDGEVSFTYRGERHFFAPQGAQGGGEGGQGPRRDQARRRPRGSHPVEGDDHAAAGRPRRHRNGGRRRQRPAGSAQPERARHRPRRRQGECCPRGGQVRPGIGSEPHLQSHQRPQVRGRTAFRRHEVRGVAGELLEAHADKGRHFLDDLVAQAEPDLVARQPAAELDGRVVLEASIASTKGWAISFCDSRTS